jgi:hypothetical protein
VNGGEQHHNSDLQSLAPTPTRSHSRPDDSWLSRHNHSSDGVPRAGLILRRLCDLAVFLSICAVRRYYTTRRTTKHYHRRHVWHSADWILVVLSASGSALLLIALLKQEVERGTRPTAHYGFFGCSGLPEPWEFR